MPVWQQAKLKLGRTMAGLSGMSPEQACHYLQAFVSEQPAPNPDNTMSEILRLRFCADDIKTIYTESALAKGSPSSRQINEWIFNNTQLGILLRDIRSRNLEHEDSTRATVCGRMLIPGAYL